ncbi:MAG: membrane protein [Alphaproteobacteria bacterium]|nr:MAG: membrane protein [Alphaproteobacteria bacterium]
MTKGSDSRRRRGAPTTIDLTASSVTTAGEPAEPAAAEPGDMPAAEPVAFDTAADNDATTSKADSGRREAAAGPEPERGQPSRAGFAVLVGAALAGGLAALIIVGGLNQAGVLKYLPLVGGLAAGEADAGLADRVAALETGAAQVETAGSDDLAGLAERLDELSVRMQAAEAALADRNSEDSRLTELVNRVDSIAEALRALRERADQQGAIAVEPADAAAAAQALEAVRSLESRLTTVEQSIRSTDGAGAALGRRIDAIEERLAANAEAQAGLAARERTALSLAGEALSAAYRRGEPFADLLESLAELAGDTPALATLRPFAATGVATDAELKRGFAELTRAMVAAAAPPPEGIVERLIANARSLVEVRPAGPTAGDEPAAVVSRIEAELDAGRLAAAHREWQLLPPAARHVSQAWADRLATRLEADAALAGLMAATGVPAGR